MNNIRKISKEDCIYEYGSIKIPEGYNNGVFCECGCTFFFKNKEFNGCVEIICKKCGRKILYG